MPENLDYGYQVPSEGDESSTSWYDVIVNFITRIVSHSHDNIDSPVLSSNTPGVVPVGTYLVFNSYSDATSYDTNYFMEADGSTIDDSDSPLDGETIEDLGSPDMGSSDDTQYIWILRYK